MGIDAEMFVRFRRDVSDEEVLWVAKELYHRFSDGLFLWGEDYGNGEDRLHCAYKVPEIEQDGPTIEPAPGEVFVKINLRGRYYGPGYERGRWHIIDSIARYLRAVWPDGEIWYGGDSSGVVHEKLDEEAQARMWAHYVKHGRHPYLKRPHPNTVDARESMEGQ